MDDATLVALAIEGDAASAGAIWDRHAGTVRGTLRRSLGNDDVEDHVQEVFLRFFRRMDALRDASALRCFLIGIAMRVAGSELRRRRVRRWLRLDATGEDVEGTAPPLDAEAREALRHLYALLDRQGTDARLLFTLRYVESLELTEISQATGVSLATVKRRLARVTARVLAGARGDDSLMRYLAHRVEEGGLRVRPG